MADFQTVFRRYERKFLMTPAQFEALQAFLRERMVPDRYGKSKVCNLYYDTPDFYLIRTSIEKPFYKEKLRIRCYGVPDRSSTTFVEIKKKYDRVIYKRRIHLPHADAMAYLHGDIPLPEPSQIGNEIDFFLQRYRSLQPALITTYDREALYGKDDPALRVTFDTDVRWRIGDLDLTNGAHGRPLLPPDRILVEIKIPGAMPLWLAHELDRLNIRRVSFSKCGRAFSTYQRSPEGAHLFTGGITL